MTATTRRIPKFHDKLRAALEGAGLPDGVEIYVDAQSVRLDPTVILQWEYKPGRYAMAFGRTDAHNPGDLHPIIVVGRCKDDAARTAVDPRYTDEARKASADFRDLLFAWITAQS